MPIASPQDSTIPAARAAIIALLQASPQLAGVDVLNGVQPPNTSNKAAITIGWSTNPLVTSAIDIKSQFADLGGQRQREQYTIHCAAQYIDGDGNLGNATQQAHSYAAIARATILASRNLGGMQLLVTPGAGSDTQEQGKYGTKVTVEFDLDVDSFTSYST